MFEGVPQKNEKEAVKSVCLWGLGLCGWGGMEIRIVGFLFFLFHKSYAVMTLKKNEENEMKNYKMEIVLK